LNFNVWVPLLARHDFATGATGFGLLMSSLGFGSLAGALTLAFRGKRPRQGLMLATALMLGILELSLAAAGAASVPYFVALPLLAGMGFAMSTTMMTANTTVQTTAPDAIRGRVMSVYMTVFAGTVPIGALIVGAIADAFGTPASLAFGGSVTIAATLAVVVASRRQTAIPPVRPVMAPIGGAPLEQRAAGGTFAARHDD
jgi:MFS family permease